MILVDYRDAVGWRRSGNPEVYLDLTTPSKGRYGPLLLILEARTSQQCLKLFVAFQFGSYASKDCPPATQRSDQNEKGGTYHVISWRFIDSASNKGE